VTASEFNPLIGPCFHCGLYGHVQADCDELKPAKTYAEHMERIRLYSERRESGQWDWEYKRTAISRENEMWYGNRAGPLLITGRRKLN
jgi:hypothetical protein